MADSGKGGLHVGEGQKTPRRPQFSPKTFGKYHLLDPIAIGGMAEVFKAKTFGHSGFEKVVVIKRILPHFANSPEFVEMFIDEAKLSVQLTHPNIVQIYDFGKINESFFIAMESVAGKDLKSIMRRQAERGEHMPPELAAYIAHEVAKGLDYAHKLSDTVGLPLNIVHRDISPSNVLVSYGGHVKIVDFGIAKAESATESSEAGVIKGKFQYMSPEQSHGDKTDHRSDIFSLGVCLWEMLTGHRLFKRPNDIESLEAVRTCQVPLPSSYNPQLSPELDRICMTALSADAGDRYQEASLLQRELEQFLLPSTPSGLAPETSRWLHERFGEEILQERERLERGTERAKVLSNEQDFTDWTGMKASQASPRRSGSTKTVQRRKVGKRKKRGVNWLLVAGSAAVLLIMACLLLLLLVPLAPDASPTNRFATLEVRVLPQGIAGTQVFLDGDLIPMRFDEVAPGVAHELRIIAPGYMPRVTGGLELVSGQVYVTEVQLVPQQFNIVRDEDRQQPSSQANPDRAAENITNSGARERTRASTLDDTSALDNAVSTSVDPGNAPRAAARPKAFLDASSLEDSAAGDLAAPVVIFRSEPSGARVFVDGRKAGVTPFEWSAYKTDQLYKVEYRLDGHQSVQAVVTSPGRGETTVLKRTLLERVALNSGTLSIEVDSGYARVFIDGTFVGTTPLLDHRLEAGEHEIKLSNPLQDIEETHFITIRTGRHTSRSFDFAQ
ncbi:MAG TPA: hypothetical protein DIU15_07065 [Deltaproteobacteria bacterium]|nr:hypothetical protein [Deltaproteobacteria bacterium]HCP45783.1 hypothetical protein [Deltaproteobacteria bacterium]